KETGPEEYDCDPKKEIASQTAGPDLIQSIAELFSRRAAHLPCRFVQDGLLPHVNNDCKERSHRRETERKEREHPEEFTKQILKARHRSRENRVDGAVLDVLWDQTRGGNDCQYRGEERHRAQRDVFQNLKFLLKAEAREEDRAGNKNKAEDQPEVKNFLSRQIGERVTRDRSDAFGHSFVASRKRRSSVLLACVWPTTLAPAPAAISSICFRSDSEAFSKTSSRRFSIASSSSNRPSRTRRPFARIPTRSQISWTCPSKCDESSTVTPRCFKWTRMFRMSRDPAGSTPAVGSSSTTSLGSLINAWASPMRWSIPFE